MSRTFKTGDLVAHFTNPKQAMVVRGDDHLPEYLRKIKEKEGKDISYQITVYWIDANGLPHQEIFEEAELQHYKTNWE